MKTKQEQIEEMAKIIDEMYWVYDTTADDIAEGLYNAGYRKIPENAVVLTKEEYIDLSRNYVTEQIEQVRKKTAKEILQCLYDKCYEIQNMGRGGIAHILPIDILQLTKHYRVEVEK